jgi:hypothetical protein
MTPTQVAINDRIVREYAARIEAIGYQGDACRFVEALLLGAIADGYREIEKPPRIRPATIADPDSPGRRAFRNAVAEIANRKKDR